MAKVHRRRLGFSDPFTPEQFESFRIVFTDCAKRVHADPEALFESTWASIYTAANHCHQQLAIQQHQKDKEPDKARTVFLTDDGFVWAAVDNPPDKRRSRIRTRKRNRFRALREAAKRGDVGWLLDKHPEEANTLLYGAIMAKVVDEKTTDHAGLVQLSAPQLRKAVAAALDPKRSVLLGSSGRPENKSLDEYGVFLARLYQKLTGHPPNTGWYDHGSRQREGEGWRGPSIRFFKAALAPFNLKTSGVRSLIERVRQY